MTKQWFIIFAAYNIWLGQFIYGIPVAQLQMPQSPQFINYVGNVPLPGGTPTSLLSGNFTPGQFITSSGIPGFLGKIEF